MAFLGTLAWCVLGALGVQIVAFCVGFLRSRRYDVVDVAWGLQVVVMSAIAFALSSNRSGVSLGLLLLVTAWGLRLSYHIFRRWLRACAEDRRYVALRASWPQRSIDRQIFIKTFILQAGLGAVVALPVLIGLTYGLRADWITGIGVLVWAVGFALEVVADAQLRRFTTQADNAGKLLTSGLWGKSRHPNYLGEILLWWGFGIMASSTPLGWLGFVGSLVITWLICFVSGIPPSEQRMASKDGWEAYQRRTPCLLPRLTKR